MYKKFFLLLVVVIGFAACTKNSKQACITACTAQYIYTYAGIVLSDSKNPNAKFNNITIINMRTNKAVVLPLYPPNVDFVAGYVLVAANDNKGEFSTSGDDIRITATDSVTGETKSTVIRISGGCNCNIAKVSGPDKLDF